MCFAGIICNLTCVEKRFRWDATTMKTRATQLVALYKSNGQT
jgi:hypothetical protein